MIVQPGAARVDGAQEKGGAPRAFSPAERSVILPLRQSVAFTGAALKLLLHAGIDKAGSTAIQAHLHANRAWLLERGVYLPQTGLTRFGHRKLFLPDAQASLWQELLDELRVAARGGYGQAVMSFEGLALLPGKQIRELCRHLAGLELSFLFYLRDQAEVLQSGYLQNLKAAAQPLGIDQLRQDYRPLTRANRDYSRMLAPFRASVGDGRIRLRPFVRNLLSGGDVVDDFLDSLSLLPGEGLGRLPMQQNPSLDVPSARLLNKLDEQGIEDRDALVDDLLWIIRRDGPQQRWFLGPAAVQALREQYRPSNEQVLKDFALSVPASVFFGLDTAAWSSGDLVETGALEVALKRLQSWPRWNGRKREGKALAPLLASGGWAFEPASGRWVCQREAVIRFRVPLSRYAQHPPDLQLRIGGHYPDDGMQSQVSINGEPRGACRLGEKEIGITAAQLGPDREIALALGHVTGEATQAWHFSLESLELQRT
jgi:hypothetical protein